MKKIITPQQKEEAVYYSDFSGENLGEIGPQVNLKLEFNYGSALDGATLDLDLSDEDVKPVLDLIKSKLSEDSKKNLEEQLNITCKSFEDSVQLRDWDSCDYLTNKMSFYKNILDMKDKE